MNKAILVAHGAGDSGTFSIKNVTTITRSGESLSFATAKEYMNSNKSWPEYASTNFQDFSPLSSVDCTALFGKTVPGSGIVSTGLRRGGDMAGALIYALVGTNDIDANDITIFMTTNKITSLVLLACRS